jgi:Ribosomal protein S10
MPFVTKLHLQSGDREALDATVTNIKNGASRKGVDLRGPHHKSPTNLRVPQYRCAGAGATFDSWSYTVYTRTMEIVGHDAFAATMAERSFPDSVRVTAEVEQVRGHETR